MGIFSFFKKKKTQDDAEKKQLQEAQDKNIENKETSSSAENEETLTHSQDIEDKKIVSEDDSKDKADISTKNDIDKTPLVNEKVIDTGIEEKKEETNKSQLTSKEEKPETVVSDTNSELQPKKNETDKTTVLTEAINQEGTDKEKTAKEVVTKESTVTDNRSKERAEKESNAKDRAEKKNNAKESALKDTSVKESTKSKSTENTAADSEVSLAAKSSKKSVVKKTESVQVNKDKTADTKKVAEDITANTQKVTAADSRTDKVKSQKTKEVITEGDAKVSMSEQKEKVSATEEKKLPQSDIPSSQTDKSSGLSDDKNEQELSSPSAKEDSNTQSENKPAKVSFFERLKRTRENLAMGLSALVSGKKIDEDLYEELETALLTADLGVETTMKVIEQLRTESKLRELKDASALKLNLKNILKDILKPCAIPLNIEKVKENLPFVILMVGVNGAGKTTTIGKLALKFKDQGKKVMLAAGDTFRAAAVEQLKAWGERTDTPVISQPTGSDSASVIFDALNAAIARGMDVLICDTAGRLQNKDNLMEELKKIVRVMKKIDENVPNEVLLVLDATTGQNAVSQLKIFGEAVNVSGLALTKLDGTAKGGVTFSLADKFKIPLRYVGIGESKEDLSEFDIDSFVDALFE